MKHRKIRPVRTGEQTRTITTECGIVFSGNPRDVNYKLRLHLKRCDLCAEAFENGYGNKIPSYDKSSAYLNGLKELKGLQPNIYLEKLT